KELSKFYNWIKKRSYEIEKDYDGYSRRIVPCESSHIELRYLPYINFFKEVIEMVALFSNTKKGEIETIINKLSELKFKEELSIKQFHEKNMQSWFTNFK
ncbi:MAG: hypothetical protein L6266_04720, partial [Nanoarchaeota archaeon]|nr:hypothetical protein [Nanoarchaeota archaeon]